MDYAIAAKLYQQAADKGQPKAQNNLARCYMNGTGVARDDVKGVEWYRKAAIQGEAMSQLNLGLMYAQGRGVPRDLIQAYAWVDLAAANEKQHAPVLRGNLLMQFDPETLIKAKTAAAKLAQQFAQANGGKT